MIERPGVLFINFGGPQRREELEPFLRNLFDDVLPLPQGVKGLALPAIARRRAASVAENYEMIGWSPLVPVTLDQVQAVRDELADDSLPVTVGMQYTAPTLNEALRELAAEGVDSVIAVAMFPHWSFATTGSSFDMLHQALRDDGLSHWPVHFAPAFHAHPDYIEALASTIRRGVADLPGEGPIHLVFTPHGLPVSYLRRGDPYLDHVHESVRRVIAHLGWDGPVHVGWQSRVGPVRWLTPATEDVLRQIGAAGGQRVCLVPVAFVSEHIETLHEIDIEYAEVAHQAGIAHFGRAPALGMEPGFIRCLADLVRQGLERFGRYTCARCLLPRPDSHRRRRVCPNCRFETPTYLRESLPESG
jgi:protoporphyrin/coproporphyrin ferrochelatase